MSASRNCNYFLARALSPRSALCLLLGVFCFVAFPRLRAQTSSGWISSQQAAITAEQTNSASARVANLNKRASLTQLPEPGDTPRTSLSMASGDFDENGVPDLVVGSAGSDSFALNLYQGNTDSIYADGRGSNNNSNIALSLLPVKSIALFVSPDFLAGGDFDGDGHHDIATAARGDDVVYLLAGNGHGDFWARRIELPGRVTTLSAMEKETGNVAGLAVGVVDDRGPAALIFRTLAGSGETSPAIVRTSSEVTCIAFRRSSFRNWTEVLIGAGKELLVRPLDRTDDGSFARHLSFSSPIRSIAVGSFGGGNGLDVAVLTADGALNHVFETESGQLIRGRNWGIFPSATHLIRARISGSDSDDLIAIDPQAHRLQLLVADAPTALDSQPTVRNRFVGSIDLEGEPVALLPMRLNEDALSDLVILKAGRAAPVSLQITAAMTFVVLNTNDSGAGSLRQAILDANSNPGTDTINFNIVGLAPHIISLLSPLPAVTESVTINGASQPDFAGTPVVELNGDNAGAAANGLTISASSSVVRGLVINGFSGHGIVVNVNGNIVEGNFIGVNSTGTFALGNGLDGVLINGGSNNTIGGTTPAARNVISGNRNGIQIIGLGTGNKIRGNFIGTNAAGTSLLGNSSNGVLINGSSGNSIGEVGSLSANTIALSGFAGVSIASGTGNSIQSNSIFSNGGLGIDLGATGVTPNDSGDPDGGANNLQNFPVLNSASAAAASTTIQGTLNSTAGTTFRIEFFSNQMPNPSGFGEGQAFIGAINVTTLATGNVDFIQNFPVAVPSQQVIAAIATDPAGNTSEFSRAIQVGSVCPTLRITCPGNISQQCSGTVSYPPPVVTGNCQGFTVVCSPPSGSVFGTGTYNRHMRR